MAVGDARRETMPVIGDDGPAMDWLARARRLGEQVLVLGTIAVIIYWLAATTAGNLQTRGITTGFGFLSKPANLAISETLIPYSPGVDTYARVVLVGALNTIFVSFIAIVLATLLGLFIGLSRLSPNWLLSRAAGAYVELIRNVPLPLQLLLWYQVLLNLPPPRQALIFMDAVVLSNRGLWLPAAMWQGIHLAMFGGAILLALIIPAAKRRMAPDRRTPSANWSWLLLVLAVLVGVALLPPEIETPALRGFNYQGGTSVSPELAALVAGLTLYSGAFIGEIVRAGILAVPSGQWEAARALGLRPKRIIQKIVLPLSLRFAIPPTANEYLNIVKNSSLAVIIGYPELAALINTMLGDTGQPIEAIAILMLAYLSISFSVSSFMNWYERRTALVTQ